MEAIFIEFFLVLLSIFFGPQFHFSIGVQSKILILPQIIPTADKYVFVCGGKHCWDRGHLELSKTVEKSASQVNTAKPVSLRPERKPPFPLRICWFPQVLLTKYLQWEGNFVLLHLPFSITWSIAHLIHLNRWPAVCLNRFYPVTGLPMKRTAVTR